MRALQFDGFGPVTHLRHVELPTPVPDSHTAIVKIAPASITPSDIKNVEGKMEGTILPRVPGRDYAGTVGQGPPEWIGAEVWGTGGEIGYTIDGSHAGFLAVPIASLCRKPRTLSMEQAASVGVTFVAAWIGLVEYSHIKPDQALIVIGVTGGVGMAAAQIAKSRGARVIGIARRQLPASFHRCTTIDKFLFLEDGPLDEMIPTPIHDLLADVVFDTVGGAMFERALRLLGHQGTLIEIASTGSRRVSFDLIDFYHNESRLLGVDTRTRDALASAKLLEAISPLFDARILRAGSSDEVISLTDGPAAYEKVARGEVCGRVTLAP